jgi:hypothetical protein
MRLKCRARHKRDFVWDNSGILLVRDSVSARRDCAVVSRVHLHPDCHTRRLGERSVRVSFPGGEATVCFAGVGELGVEEFTYCPEFGVMITGEAITFSTRGRAVETAFCVVRGEKDVALDVREGAVIDGCAYGW